MSLLLRRCKNRSHQLEEYLETWQIDHQNALYVCDLEQLVQDCLQLMPLLRQAWDHTVERLFDKSKPSEMVFVEEQTVRRVVSMVSQLCRRVSGLIDEAEQAGYSVDATEAFRGELRDLVFLEKEIESQWPPTNSQHIRESLDAYGRGEYQSAEDMLREAQGNGAETH